MWDAIVVGVIVLAAAAWVGRRLWRTTRGQDGCAGCSDCARKNRRDAGSE